MKASWRAALAAIVAAGALAACGGDSAGDDGVATLGQGTNAQPSASADPPKDREEALLAFARCMRENGVDMPDPEPGGPVRIGPGGGRGPATEAQARAFDTARQKCEHHMEGAAGMGPGGGSVPQEMQEKLLAMAECMREHGFDMPDPTFDGGRVLSRLPEGVDPNSPKVKQAQDTCRAKVGLTGRGGMVGGGRS